MPGLLNPNAAPAAPDAATTPAPGGAQMAPQQAQGQPQQGGQPAPQQGSPISAGPVDDDLLKKYIANCMNVVTGSLPAIAKMIGDASDKVAALAQASVHVIIRVEDSLEQSGGQLNLNMTFAGGAEALSDIVDAMEKMGVYTFKQDEIDSAFLQAVDQYRMTRQQQGRLDPAQFQQLVQQMKQQEQAGTLNQAFPGLKELASKSGGGGDNEEGETPDNEGEGDDGTAPAPGPSADTGTQDFPEAMLKKHQRNQIAVKPHYRKRPDKRRAPKALPNQRGGMAPPMKPRPNGKGAA